LGVDKGASPGVRRADAVFRSLPGELSMWEAEAFLEQLVDFGGLMATGGYPLPRAVA